MVKPEFTGERDLAYSRWHRTIGERIYATDMDFVESTSKGVPVAIVEAKKWGSSLGDFQYNTYTNVGNMLGVPAFFVQYPPGCNVFRIMPINDLAQMFVPNACILSESDWIRILYEVHDSCY